MASDFEVILPIFAVESLSTPSVSLPVGHAFGDVFPQVTVLKIAHIRTDSLLVRVHVQVIGQVDWRCA